MSGWDEGAVFYSDQAQFPRGGPGGDPAAADITRHSVLRKFKEFLRGFTGPTGDFPTVRASCTTATMSPSPSRTSTRSMPSCRTRSGRRPPITCCCLRRLGARFLASLRSKVAGETGETEKPVTGDVQIFLSSNENCLSMRSIGADYMSKLVKQLLHRE